MVRFLIFTLALVTTAFALPISTEDDVTAKIEEPGAGVQIKEQYTEPDAVKPVSAQVENAQVPSQEQPVEKYSNINEVHVEEPKAQSSPDVKANEKYTEVADTKQPVSAEVANPNLQISQNVNPDQKYIENANAGQVATIYVENTKIQASPEVNNNIGNVGPDTVEPVAVKVEANAAPEVPADEKYSDVVTASETPDVKSKAVSSESVFPVLVEQTPQVVNSGVQLLSVLPINQEFASGEIVEPIFVPTKLLSETITYVTIEPILPQFSRSDVADNEKQQATQLASVDCSPVENHSSKSNQQVFGVQSDSANAENTQQQQSQLVEDQADEKKQESHQQTPVSDERTSVEVNQQPNPESYVTKDTESKPEYNETPAQTPVQSQVVDSKQQPNINPQGQVSEVEKPAI